MRHIIETDASGHECRVLEFNTKKWCPKWALFWGKTLPTLWRAKNKSYKYHFVGNLGCRSLVRLMDYNYRSRKRQLYAAHSPVQKTGTQPCGRATRHLPSFPHWKDASASRRCTSRRCTKKVFICNLNIWAVHVTRTRNSTISHRSDGQHLRWTANAVQYHRNMANKVEAFRNKGPTFWKWTTSPLIVETIYGNKKAST